MRNLIKKGQYIITRCLAIFVGLSVFSYTMIDTIEPIQAAGSYPYACGTSYSVDQANSDGTLSNIYCTNDLSDAQRHMNSSVNYVVRARDNLSPSKIVMMHGGLVYTYPMRSGKSTLDLTHWSNDNTATTYVTKHREMLYGWTDWASGDNGRIAVSVNGFDGYVNLKEVDLIPWAWVDNNVLVTLGGHDTTSANEQPFSTRIRQSHYTVSESNGQKLLTFTWSSGWSSNGNPATYNHPLGPVPDNIANGTYYSYDGYTFYTDRACKNQSFTYYNYYQYLPFRTKTNLTADEMNAFIAQGVNGRQSVLLGKGQAFLDAQEKYGINAAIVLSIAILESGYGTSDFAINRNNLFGISAYDSNPNSATSFSSVEDCINQMMGYYLKDYSDIKDTRFYGAHLGNKGSGANVKYAADNYWGLKIASLYYQMDAYSNGANLADYNTVSRGLITTYDATVYLNPGSNALYSTANKAGYQEAFIIPVISSDNGWTQWQCNNKIENGNIVSNGFLTYDWGVSRVYTRSSDILVINDASSTETIPDGSIPTGDFNFVPTMAITDGQLIISGSAYRPGIAVNDANTLSHTVTLINQYYSGTTIETQTSVENGSIGHFSASLDLTTLDIGQYTFTVSTHYGFYDEYDDLDHLIGINGSLPQDVVIDEKRYHFENDNDGITTLLVSSEVSNPEQPSEPIVPEEPETPQQPDTPQEDELPHILMSTLRSSDLDGSTLTLSGTAYLTNINATEDMADQIDVSVRLIDRNDPDGEGYLMDASMGMYDTQLVNGQFKYDYIAYQATIDISTLPNSVYTVEITVTNGDVSGTNQLYSSNEDCLLSQFIEGDAQQPSIMFELNENFEYGYRVELNKEYSDVDVSTFTINKPSRQSSTITVDRYAVDLETQELTFSGSSFIHIVDITGDTIPVGRIYLVSLNDGKYYEGTIEWQQGSQALPNTNGFTVTNASYQASFDLSGIPDGEYKLMLYQEIKTNGATYSDYYEVRSATVRQGIHEENDTRAFTFEQTSIRNRIKLSITAIGAEKTNVLNIDDSTEGENN